VEITLATPALLFPALSLLLLAYTNRFLGLATLIRNLVSHYQESRERLVLRQIENLRHRLKLIRSMQAFGVASIFVCVVCMFALFAGNQMAGKALFGASLVLLMLSLALSFREIQLSTHSLDLALEVLERDAEPGDPGRADRPG
jgi:hypothetical protein